MKYIIVGLGNFGSSLAMKLTAQGNEVIGVDNSMEKVEAFKEKISHTICMDSTDEIAVRGLPLDDTDVVIVSIGEDQGASVMTTALFKNLNVKRLISRAINPLHEKVLASIGITEIVHPEEETAERWSKKLCLCNVKDSFELGENYSIIEAGIPKQYIGKSIREVEFRVKHNLLVLTIIKETTDKSLFGKLRKTKKVQGVVKPDEVLREEDNLVLYGSNKDLEAFLKKEIE